MKRKIYGIITASVLALVMAFTLIGFFACGDETENTALASISVTKAPTKVDYTEGEKFNKAGMVVTAKYEDNSEKAVSSYTYSPGDALKTTDKEIVVTYKEGDVTKTAKQEITVVAAPPSEPEKVRLTSIKVLKADNTEYKFGHPIFAHYALGDTFTAEGMKVQAVYSDKTVKEITDYTVSLTEKLTVNDTAAKVSYSEEGETAVTYLRLMIDAPEFPASACSGATELKFSDENNYVVASGAAKATWTSVNGNTFDRVRCWNKTGANIIFEHDYTSLEDKTQAGFTTTLNASRGGTVVSVSNDGETWTEIARAGNGENLLPADYKLMAKSIAGKPIKDENDNMYRVYYGLGDYLKSAGRIYIKFSYEPLAEGCLCLDKEGADLVNSLTFYDVLDLSRAGETEDPDPSVTVESLAITSPPTKTVYSAGDSFNVAGMVVTASYSDGTSAPVTDYAFSPDGALGVDDHEITIAYGGKTAPQPITVKPSELPDSDYEVAAELLFSEPDNYRLMNGAIAETKNSQDKVPVARLRCKKAADAYIQFEYDFSGISDRSQIGFMMYALHSRTGTYVQASADGENWTDLARVSGDLTLLPADWKKHDDHPGGNNMKDANMYAMYYRLGSFMTDATKVYVKVGYEPPEKDFKDNEGADLFYSVTFYNKLDLGAVI